MLENEMYNKLIELYNNWLDCDASWDECEDAFYAGVKGKEVEQRPDQGYNHEFEYIEIANEMGLKVYNNKDINEALEEDDKAWDRETIFTELSKLTKNFTRNEGEISTWYEEEKEHICSILRDNKYQIEVSDGRLSNEEDMNWVITYVKIVHESLEEATVGGKEVAKQQFLKELANLDYDVGHTYDPDDFSYFQRCCKDDGWDVTEEDFEKYFEYLDEVRAEANSIEESIWNTDEDTANIKHFNKAGMNWVESKFELYDEEAISDAYYDTEMDEVVVVIDDEDGSHDYRPELDDAELEMVKTKYIAMNESVVMNEADNDTVKSLTFEDAIVRINPNRHKADDIILGNVTYFIGTYEGGDLDGHEFLFVLADEEGHKFMQELGYPADEEGYVLEPTDIFALSNGQEEVYFILETDKLPSIEEGFTHTSAKGDKAGDPDFNTIEKELLAIKGTTKVEFDYRPYDGVYSKPQDHFIVLVMTDNEFGDGLDYFKNRRDWKKAVFKKLKDMGWKFEDPVEDNDTYLYCVMERDTSAVVSESIESDNLEYVSAREAATHVLIDEGKITILGHDGMLGSDFYLEDDKLIAYNFEVGKCNVTVNLARHLANLEGQGFKFIISDNIKDTKAYHVNNTYVEEAISKKVNSAKSFARKTMTEAVDEAKCKDILNNQIDWKDDDVDAAREQLRSLHTEGEISEEEYNYITSNWDSLLEKKVEKASDLFNGKYVPEWLWHAVCNADNATVQNWFAEGNPVNLRYSRFNGISSLIMGALRNGNSQTVELLQSYGETILPEEQEEYDELRMYYGLGDPAPQYGDPDFFAYKNKKVSNFNAEMETFCKEKGYMTKDAVEKEIEKYLEKADVDNTYQSDFVYYFIYQLMKKNGISENHEDYDNVEDYYLNIVYSNDEFCRHLEYCMLDESYEADEDDEERLKKLPKIYGYFVHSDMTDITHVMYCKDKQTLLDSQDEFIGLFDMEQDDEYDEKIMSALKALEQKGIYLTNSEGPYNDREITEYELSTGEIVWELEDKGERFVIEEVGYDSWRF